MPFFQANGISTSSYTNMYQMRVALPKWQQDFLCVLDGIGEKCVKCPQDAPSNWKKAFDDGSAYRNIPDPQTLYLKLSDTFQAFDMFRNTIDCDELKRGQVFMPSDRELGRHRAQVQLADRSLQQYPPGHHQGDQRVHESR